ncbi:MAG: DUF3325 family protein [Pseudomonadota bacterium]
MTHVLAFVLCLAAFAALAMGVDRQQDDLFGRSLSQAMTRGLRMAATALLLLALTVLVTAHGWGLGLVLFSGHTSAAAGAVFFTLIAWARRTART